MLIAKAVGAVTAAQNGIWFSHSEVLVAGWAESYVSSG
jgi:hypothetical protein